MNLFLLVSGAVVFAWSFVGAFDLYVWALEVAPAVIALIVLLATYRRFKLTGLAYVLIWIHAIVLMVGGHYTYSRMPLFDWLRDSLDLSRNYYDRLGHFFQGFTPSIVAREILARKSPVKGGGWLFFIVLCVVLAGSAFYEFMEWWVAVASGTAADEFLATQGDIWDTQWDMFMAFVGGVTALLLLGKAHDRALDKIASRDIKSGKV